MAKLTLTAEVDELVEAYRDLAAALIAAPSLPGHLARRLAALAESDIVGCESEYFDGVLRCRPSGELLAVLALVRGHAARTGR